MSDVRGQRPDTGVAYPRYRQLSGEQHPFYGRHRCSYCRKWAEFGAVMLTIQTRFVHQSRRIMTRHFCDSTCKDSFLATSPSVVYEASA